jgi:hypothetical protein
MNFMCVTALQMSPSVSLPSGSETFTALPYIYLKSSLNTEYGY